MGGIPVCRIIHEPAAPGGLAGFGVAQAGEGVEVGAIGIGEFAEEPGLGHCQHGEIGAVVAAVFGHHVEAARALDGFDELPAFLDGYGGGDFAQDGFAVV